jgi:NAD(P)-dependent dehydrogenase (short-subunit alcohol dehydrogenase family)
MSTLTATANVNGVETLLGKVALVIGASRGIGHAIALALLGGFLHEAGRPPERPSRRRHLPKRRTGASRRRPTVPP